MSQAVLSGVARTLRTMADGTVRLAVDFDPLDRAAVMELFGEPGAPMAVTRLTQAAAQSSLQGQVIEQERPQYGDEAKALRLSRFFYTPDVWRAIGTDAEFLAWLRTQRCAARTQAGCEGHIEAAHVRRVANGSGTGIKPAYSAIALCQGHHRLQHQHGESVLGGREWFDKQRIDHVVAWAWQALKAQLGYETWSELPPHVLCEWALEHGLQVLLPGVYLEGVQDIKWGGTDG